MTLTVGTRLGVYDVIGPIGHGGMGHVYRAHDTTLKRDVALKILPDAFANDPDRLARFTREAQTLAALNHPNIAHIHGLEESGGVRALVMELVEGDDLSQRMSAGAIPADEALPIAKQVAEALEAAHEQGIIHRDLKPANIKVRSDGTVKVLDFGLAKALEPSGVAAPSGSQSPTITAGAMTQLGVILGTAAYMSPEQASGKRVDKRSDIWSFGVVLFEMLTGRRLFDGETVSDALANVLRGPIEFSQLPADTPKPIRDLLSRCLNRDVMRRLRDVGDARLQLEDVLSGAREDGSGPAATSSAAAASLGKRERLVWLSALTLVTAAALMASVAWVRARPGSAAPSSETRLEIATPPGADPFSFAISPDGRQVVFAAPAAGGRSQLWLRALDVVTAQPLNGTEGGTFPFWSPDSRSLGFFAGDSLKRIDIGGGPPQTLASPANRGGSWSPDGVILFGSTNAPLARVPATGGDVIAVTTLGPDEVSHRFPHVLPGGRQFLYYVYGAASRAGIYLGSLDTPDVKRIIDADTPGAYAPSGWLFFARQRTLFAQRFDAARGQLTGDPVTVADPVAVEPNVRGAAFSVSATGLVTYRTGGSALRQLTWFDRGGKPLATLGAPDETQADPALAPDGHRVAMARLTQRSNFDIWVIDEARTTRFTFDPRSERYAVWSPDGSRLAFRRSETHGYGLYQKPSSGAGAEELVLASPVDIVAESWSSDRRFLLYSALSPRTADDLSVLAISGDRRAIPFLTLASNEPIGAFSPDGHWVAYQSDEGDRSQIYIRPFPGPGGQWQVSTQGGISPRWRPDGKELYYVAPDSTMMAVPIVYGAAALEPGAPTPLFQSQIFLGGAGASGDRQQYDVASDGRFLINVTTAPGTTAPITVIEHWKPPSN